MPILLDTSSMNPTPQSPIAIAEGWKKSIVRVVRFVVIAYLLIVVAFVFFENSLLFFPSRYPQGDWELPSDVQDAWFNSADGTKLHGWYIESEPGRPVVLFCHGNAGNIAVRRHLMPLFAEMKVTALMFDYRGYGRSEGSPSGPGILADARAARAWLAKRANVPEDQVVLWGESIGGAVAIDLASDGARGLIVENTFHSLPEVAKHHFPWLPIKLCMRNRFESGEKIGNYRGPLLQFHGDADEIVPYSQGQKLFQRANQPKEFVTVAGANHNDPRTTSTLTAIGRFLGELD